MNTIRPRISIGLPVFNGEAYLEQTLECLLGQDLREFELVIVDNASTDRTREICEAFVRRDGRIRYFRNDRNLGAAANYNRAFRLARAPLFKWAPHDDLYAPTFLRRCLEVMEASGPEVVLCYPKTLLIDESGMTIGEHADELELADPKPAQRLAGLLDHRTSWCHPVVGVIRTDVLRTTRLIGGFAGADHVLMVELALRGRFREWPEPLFFRRVHAGLSPSLHANVTPEDRDAWFDTRNASRISVPRTRLLVEQMRAIHRAEVGPRERWACYRLLRTSPFAEHWSRTVLLQEWQRALRMATWDRWVLGGVRRARSQYLPHRLWALLSGVKRLDVDRVLLALSPPSRSTHDALLDFVAGCLSRRADRRSREILEEWRTGGIESHQRAATRAGQRHWLGVTG